MTQNEHDSLCSLEHLMEEFFSCNTNNEKKHEIEVELGAFSNQRDSWKLCIYFLNHTSSQYVSMYALSTIEAVINRQWVILDWEQRLQIKTALYSYLFKHNATCPNFLRNKIAKLLVDIARHDWPLFYSEYITIILQLLQSEQEQLLGLILLHTTSEELMNTNVDVSLDRKEELHCLLFQHVPQLFQILTNILDVLGTKPRHTVTATPPPSPTHPSSAPDLSQPQLNTATFRPDSKELTKEALTTVQHMFSWVNLSQITPEIIKAVFRFTNSSSYAQDDDDMCVLAMSAINELLYRKCAPPGSQDLFTELYHYAIELLNDITSSRKESSLDFVNKLTEFLCLLLSQHLWKLETNNKHFSAINLLSTLYQFTFQQITIDCFLSCLDVWRSFIKQLKQENVSKYSEALSSFADKILKKIRFMHNSSELKELNNDIFDDDNETEWQHFIKECIEVVALITELIPGTVLNLVWTGWDSVNELYHKIEENLNANGRLVIYSDDNVRYHHILKDLSTLTQTLARLSSFTDQDQHCEGRTCADLLVSDLLKSTLYATRMRYDRRCDRMQDMKFYDDFIEVHAQLLAALKTWCLWLVNNRRDLGHQLGDTVMTTTSILLNGHEDPSKLSLPAAHLLLCLTNIIFPPNLITLSPVVELLHAAPVLSYRDEHTLNIIYQALCNLLIRPWGDLNETDKNQRLFLIRSFFDALTKNFRELTSVSEPAHVKHTAGTILPRLSQIVEYCKHHSTASKKLLHSGIQTTIEHALNLFPNQSGYPEVGSIILEFFLIVLEVLQQQLGLEFIKTAVQMFLDVAIREQQSHQLSGLDKLLQILQLVVEGPGFMYKAFLPGILTLCIDHVYPLVASQPNHYPDLISALLTLLHSIMHHRWQYFYTSQVRLGYSPGTSDASGASESESLHNREQLLSILQTFGQALLQPDINIFRLSLASLEHLNSKWKLYHKMLFKEQLLSQFLTVLLQTLLHKSHALLNDDITLAIYNMSSVDFDVFFSTFLLHFLQSMEGLDDNQRETLKRNFHHDTDMPTFVQNIHRFINDMRCYQICNASLPSGSITL